MSMIRLAFLNFKNSFRNYLSLVVSLAFTVLVLFNFQNLIDSEAFGVLGTRNKEYVEIIVQTVSFVLGCFMFFFIWYSTNVFLTRRKREIGIYVFMGLSNERIGKMYLVETILGAGSGAGLWGLKRRFVPDDSAGSIGSGGGHPIPAGNPAYGFYGGGLWDYLYDFCGEGVCEYYPEQCAWHDLCGEAE